MGIFSTRRRVARTRSGRYELNLPSHERALVVNLVDQLRDVLAASTDDPSVRRLFPTAYAQDAERDREYQQLVRDELLERRLSALATVEETAEATEVRSEEHTSELQSLMRLSYDVYCLIYKTNQQNKITTA